MPRVSERRNFASRHLGCARATATDPCDAIETFAPDKRVLMCSWRDGRCTAASMCSDVRGHGCVSAKRKTKRYNRIFVLLHAPRSTQARPTCDEPARPRGADPIRAIGSRSGHWGNARPDVRVSVFDATRSRSRRGRGFFVKIVPDKTNEFDILANAANQLQTENYQRPATCAS